MVPRALPAAAYGLMALLVAMLPANVHAAREGLMIAGRRAAPLVWRFPLQVFWIAALWWVRAPTPVSDQRCEPYLGPWIDSGAQEEIVVRKIIAALQVSLDGFIEGPNEELDWVDPWENTFNIIGNVDACILGARMYPGYEQVPGRGCWTIRGASCRSPAGPRPKGRSNMPSSPAGRRTLSCRARSRPSRGSTRESFAISRPFAD